MRSSACLVVFVGVAALPGVVSLPSRFSASYGGGQIEGYMPNDMADNEQYPVFIMFGGSGDGFWPHLHESTCFEMAMRGYIAADIEYDVSMPMGDFCGEVGQKTESIIVGPSSALHALCSMERADCSKGVATTGHSQGGYVALLAATLDSRISATMPLAIVDPDCVKDELVSQHLPRSKRRYINVLTDWTAPLAVDHFFGSTEINRAASKAISGYDCGAANDCIQADGSGYYLVTADDYKSAECDDATHTFYYNSEDGANVVTNSSTFLCDYLSDAIWAMPANFDWLGGAAKTSEGQVGWRGDWQAGDAQAATPTSNTPSCLNECPPADQLKGMVTLGAVGLAILGSCCCCCGGILLWHCLSKKKSGMGSADDDFSSSEEDF